MSLLTSPIYIIFPTDILSIIISFTKLNNGNKIMLSGYLV